MGRPSRLSSDGDLLNVCNPAFWQHFVTPPPDAKLRGCGKIDVEKVESKIPQILLQIYKPHAWRANIDDGYVDNCEQKKAMIW
ncbi:17585_t:CDS:2 [Rhizophagus irregularis]|nr:17585_t:CDS:2 [Rhizophagus irregularis]